MTIREIGEFISEQQKKEEDDFKEKAILLDNAVAKILKFFSKESGVLTLHDLYPGLFNAKNKPIEKLTPEQKQARIVQAWDSFLS